MQSALQKAVTTLAALAALPAIYFAIDAATSSYGSFGRGLGAALTTASAGAFLTTSLPALAAVGRWPWAALGLVLLYPIAWIGIMMQL